MEKINKKKSQKKVKALVVFALLLFLFFNPFYNVAHAGDNPFTSALEYIVKLVLQQIFVVCGWLFNISATLFAWVIDPKNMSGQDGILNKPAIKDVWIMVRDLLNMTFILILLFSAFCTIFQYDKWGLKKVWLNILINALLVNFSFPIARFIIDISNVMFYYFVNNLFTNTGVSVPTGSSIFATLLESSKIADILAPTDYFANPIGYLIVQIIFVFTFGMTLLIIAGLFVVRLIALAIIIMFSPIGFVGYIFPSWSKYADDWWDSLFAYSFFAPIMIFMLNIALRVSQQIKAGNFANMQQQSIANSTGENTATWFANVAFYAIPIIILWTGIAVAQKMKIAAAGQITSAVKKGGKWLANMPLKVTGVSGGVKQAKEYYGKRGVRIPFTNKRVLGSDQTDDASAFVAGKLGVPNARDNNMLKRMEEAKKELNMGDMNAQDRNNLWARGNSAQRLALALQNAEDGDLTDDQMQWVMDNYRGTAMAKKVLSKAKDKNPEVAINHLLNQQGAIDPNEVDKVINKIDPKDVTESMARNRHFMELYVPKNKVGIEEYNKMSAPVQAAYRQTVEALADESRRDTTNRNNRNIMMQHLAISGDVAPGLEDYVDANGVHQNLSQNRSQMWSRMNKKHAENITPATLQSHGDEMASNIDPKNVVEFMLALPAGSRGDFMRRLRASNRPELRAVLRDRSIASY